MDSTPGPVALAAVLSDPARLAAVRDVLDGGESAARSFDRLARLAARLLNVPVALVTLVTDERQVFLGLSGLSEPWATLRETPLTHSFCQHVVGRGVPMAVEDARRDPLLAGNGAIPDLGVIGYAGIPLVLEGRPLGSLCAIDPRPHAWTQDELDALEDLTASVMTEIELRAEVGRRRRAEASFRMLEKAVEVMQLGVTVTGLKGHIVYTNPAEAAMHGYAPEEITGLHASLFAPPELRVGPQAAPDRVMRWVRDSVNLRKDGSRFPVRLWSDVLTGEDGQVVGSVTCCEDLSEIRAAEEAVAESETRFRFLTDTIPQQVWTATADGTLDYASRAAYVYFGLRAGTPVADVWLSRVHPADQPAVVERWTRSVQTGEPYEVEFRLQRHDGEYRWHLGRARADRNPAGEVVRWYGTNTDITDQKAAAEALRASEERFRELAEHVREVFYVMDPDQSRVLYVSPAYEQVWGRRRDTLYTQPWEWVEALHPDDRERVRAAVNDRELGTYDEEYRIRTPEGEERWVHDRAFPVRATDGRILRFVGFAAEITARKRAEQALVRARDELERRVDERTAELAQAVEQLRASEREYRGLFENAHDALMILHPQGEVVLAANARAEQLYGVADGELVGRSLRDFSDDPRLGEQRLRDTLDGAHATHFTTRQHRADGAGMQVEVNAFLVEYRGSTAILSINRDVTDRFRAEEALRRSEARFRAMFESSAAGIALLDGAGAVVETNAALHDLLGRPPASLTGTALAVLAHPRDADALGRGARSVLHGGRGHWRGEVRFLDGAGRTVWAHVTLSAVADSASDGGRYGIVIVQNVTERRQAQEALSRSEELLRHAQKLEAVGRLAGGVAHDFNNLLMAILTHVYALQHGPALDEGARESAGEIQRAAERAAELTRQLLAFSRRQVLEPEVLDLNGVVAGVERMARRLVGEDVEVQLRVDPRLPAVRADRGQLEQAVMNLMVNARDAMPNGGRLVVETESVRVGAGVAGLSRGEYALLTVSDNGHGMDAEVRERIFEPFFTTKEVGRGTGLGLSTVYGIVQQSGGAVFVDSQPGEGTRFRLYFPATAGVPERAAPHPLPEPDGGGETLLLVEDEEQLRAPLSRSLRERGYVVLEAADGREALEVAAGHPGAIDLLLSDVVMPRMGGVELARKLARERPGKPVLLMSGHASGPPPPGLVAAVLQKPVPPDELARRIRAVLDGREAGQ
ncbi:MAG TPA: PAS domain S-box protein [Longimicrobium sp.]|jgi:PAS domain S-box-containing protein|uniref:PAS domain S-box protein n=1 Tax=Longimicrobium sp. TaxID=2029185 RepID=UPI002ED81A94